MSSYEDELDYWEKERSIYADFLKNDALKIELGKTYLQESDSWARKHFKIVFVDDKIAVGIVVYCGIYNSNVKNCGNYQLFKVGTGEKYQDSRLCYRLKKEVG